MFKMRNKKKQEYSFSIISATIGKTNRLEKLCKALKEQEYKKFELIICDQNKENFNKKLKYDYKNIKITFIKSKKGLSIARNKGIMRAKGNYLLFLDDDISLKKNFFKMLNQLFNINKAHILCYKVQDNKKKPLLNYPKKSCFLRSPYQIFNSISSVSYAISNKRKIFFNEKLGLGSRNIYQSGEETDYILRAVKKFNYKIFFTNKLFVEHFKKEISIINEIKKSFFYGCGWGYVVKKNNLGLNFMLINILKIFLNIFYNLLTLKFNKGIISISTFFGRIFGLIF